MFRPAYMLGSLLHADVFSERHDLPDLEDNQPLADAYVHRS